jgi:hypothetical protein
MRVSPGNLCGDFVFIDRREEPMQSTEVIESLQNIRGEVEAHLRNVKEYRAFLAIQVAMDEISHVGELHSPLESVREGVRGRLNETREYRALLAVEKSITDIAGVLGLLDEITPRSVAQAPAEPAPADTLATEGTVEAQGEAPSAATQTEAVSQPAEVAVAEVAVAAAASEVTPEQLEVAAPAVTAENAGDWQPTTAQTEAAPQPAEVAIAAAPAEVTPEQIETVAAPAPIEATAETTPTHATAEIPAFGFSAPQAADIVVPTVMLADVPPTSDTTPAGVEQEVDSLRVALGAAPVGETESPAPLVAAAEANWESADPGVGSEHVQAEPQQTIPEHDQAIAKVA